MKELPPEILKIIEVYNASLFETVSVEENLSRKSISIIAMVGLVGSGKSSVARYIAEQIQGIIIRSDEIRVLLRQKELSYEYVQDISHEVVLEAFRRGFSVVVDSDFVQEEKRKIFEEEIHKAEISLGLDQKVKIKYVRVYAPGDEMIGRMIAYVGGDVEGAHIDFYKNTIAEWSGDKSFVPKIVAIREMWRRTPHHYDWKPGAGEWMLKKFDFVDVEVDSTKDIVGQLENFLK